MTSPTVDPAHIDSNARIARAQHVAADAIKRAEAAEAEVADRLRELTAAYNERNQWSGIAIAWRRWASDLVVALGLEEKAPVICGDDAQVMTRLRTQLAARPAAVPAMMACGATASEAIGPLRQCALPGGHEGQHEARDGEGELVHAWPNARPAAESVAVPPEVPRWTVYSPAGGGHCAHCPSLNGALMPEVRRREDAELQAEVLNEIFVDHWPRAVSSEEVERLRAERDEAIAARERWQDQDRVDWLRAKHAEDLCNALMSAGLTARIVAENEAYGRGYRAAEEDRERALTAARAQGAADGWQAAIDRVLAEWQIHPAAREATLRERILALKSETDVEDELRARAAAAGAEGQTSGNVGAVADGEVRERSTTDTARHADAPTSRGADGPKSPASSPPPCAACGGSGTIRRESWSANSTPQFPGGYVLKCDACKGTGHAPPPASSATAGEDEVEARCALLANEAEGAFPEDVAAAILSLVRSERRRAWNDAVERARQVVHTWLDESGESDREVELRVRALGGEEG